MDTAMSLAEEWVRVCSSRYLLTSAIVEWIDKHIAGTANESVERYAQRVGAPRELVLKTERFIETKRSVESLLILMEENRMLSPQERMDVRVRIDECIDHGVLCSAGHNRLDLFPDNGSGVGIRFWDEAHKKMALDIIERAWASAKACVRPAEASRKLEVTQSDQDRAASYILGLDALLVRIAKANDRPEVIDSVRRARKIIASWALTGEAGSVSSLVVAFVDLPRWAQMYGCGYLSEAPDVMLDVTRLMLELAQLHHYTRQPESAVRVERTNVLPEKTGVQFDIQHVDEV